MSTLCCINQLFPCSCFWFPNDLTPKHPIFCPISLMVSCSLAFIASPYVSVIKWFVAASVFLIRAMFCAMYDCHICLGIIACGVSFVCLLLLILLLPLPPFVVVVVLLVICLLIVLVAGLCMRRPCSSPDSTSPRRRLACTAFLLELIGPLPDPRRDQELYQLYPQVTYPGC